MTISITDVVGMVCFIVGASITGLVWYIKDYGLDSLYLKGYSKGYAKALRDMECDACGEPIVQTEDCTLKEFGKCTYSKTGCSDCEVKSKIRNALSTQTEII